MQKNQDEIVRAIEFDPKKAITYSGDTLPKLDLSEYYDDDGGDDEPELTEYSFIDTDEESEEPSTSKPAEKVSMFNLDKDINEEYKTLLKDKGYDLPSKIFEKQINVDTIIQKVKSKIKLSPPRFT